MQCKLILFSPTGGTAKAAHVLCDALADVTDIQDLCSPTYTSGIPIPANDTVAVIAVPSYGGRVPPLAMERLAAIHAEGTPCVLLCVFGNRAFENTLIELDDIARRCGFRPFAAVSAVAEHSIIRSVAAGRPDAQDAAELRDFGQQIRKQLAEGTPAAALPLPGKLPDKSPSATPFVPRPTTACTKCGACSAQCPAGAIDTQDQTKVDKKKCIACMRCVAVCPNKCRGLGTVVRWLVSTALLLMCRTRRPNKLYMQPSQ